MFDKTIYSESDHELNAAIVSAMCVNDVIEDLIPCCSDDFFKEIDENRKYNCIVTADREKCLICSKINTEARNLAEKRQQREKKMLIALQNDCNFKPRYEADARELALIQQQEEQNMLNNFYHMFMMKTISKILYLTRQSPPIEIFIRI